MTEVDRGFELMMRYSAMDSGATDRHRGAALVLISFAMLIVSLDQYIVVVALPEIASHLG
jgi:hypothetical protein